MAKDTTQELLELIERVRNGDRGAAARFAVEYFPELRARIRYRIPASLRREFDSEDAVASAARRLDEAVATGRVRTITQTSLQGFLATSAMHSISDRIRAAKTRARRESAHARMLARNGAPPPDAAAGAAILSKSPLGDDDREILRLVGAGLSQKAIACALDKSEANIRMRLVRARRQCRQESSHESAATRS